MFNTYETVIDAVQTAKKTAVATFVKNDTIAESLTKWIDTETTVAKTAIKAGTETATAIGLEVTKAIGEATKFDYAKNWATWAQDLQKGAKASK